MQKCPLINLARVCLLLMPFSASAAVNLPKTIKLDPGKVEPVCNQHNPEWRKAAVIEGVKIQESLRCSPDDPASIAVQVKGTNNIAMSTLMDTFYAADAITKKNDIE